MNFTGTSGKDNLAGTTGDDIFDMSQGGNDTIDGDDGNDVVQFGATMTGKDKFDGGIGTDRVELDGDYSFGLTLGKHSLTSVERMDFAFGHSYDITLKDANTSGTFQLSAGSLGAGDDIVFNASHDTDTAFNLFGGAGDDVFKGGDFSNTFTLQGGSDQATGGDGLDVFDMVGSFDATDKLRGEGGNDILGLFGDYSAGLVLTHSMMRDIEYMQTSGSFGYDISTDDNLLASGETLNVSSDGLTGGHSITFDGSAETDGRFTFTDGAANDTFTGGAGDDVISCDTGGDDIADGGDGDDTFSMLGGLSAGDVLDGHHGDDMLTLSGDYSGGLTLVATTIHSVETILFVAGHSYDLTMDDANVEVEDTLLVDGSTLFASDTLRFDGTAEVTSNFDVTGGAGADTLIGGAQADTLAGGDGDDTLNGRQGADSLNGGAGADTLNGGLGDDTFVYAAVADSTGADHDVLGTFATATDFIDLPGSVNAIDARINAGTLNAGNFDADMAAAVNSGNLGVGNAVIFQANGGDLSGHKYLIVEANGSAGYQAGADYVIEIDTGVGLNALSTANFV